MGLLVVDTGRKWVKLGPSLTIEAEDIERGCKILKEAVQEVLDETEAQRDTGEEHEIAVKTYMDIGWIPKGPPQTFITQKMVDNDGNIVEFIEGEYHNHISVNWVADEDGNWIELVEVKK